MYKHFRFHPVSHFSQTMHFSWAHALGALTQRFLIPACPDSCSLPAFLTLVRPKGYRNLPGGACRRTLGLLPVPALVRSRRNFLPMP